jgi:hypothetical protein
MEKAALSGGFFLLRMANASGREAAGPGRFLTAVDAAFLRAGHAALELDLLQSREAL